MLTTKQIDKIQAQYALLAMVVNLAREYALDDNAAPEVIKEQIVRVTLETQKLERLIK